MDIEREKLLLSGAAELRGQMKEERRRPTRGGKPWIDLTIDPTLLALRVGI